jgi:hypothetical protein
MQVSDMNNSTPSYFGRIQHKTQPIFISMKFKYLPLLLNKELIEPEIAPLFHSFYLKHILSCNAILPLMHPHIDSFMPCHCHGGIELFLLFSYSYYSKFV